MDMFKVKAIIELEKELSFKNAYECKKILQEKYDLTNRECSEIYIGIVNHQVQKYGSNFAGAFNKDNKIKRTDNIFKRVKQRR